MTLKDAYGVEVHHLDWIQLEDGRIGIALVTHGLPENHFAGSIRVTVRDGEWVPVSANAVFAERKRRLLERSPGDHYNNIDDGVVDYELFDTSALLDVLESFKDASPPKHQPLLLAAIHRLEALEAVEERLQNLPRLT